MERLSAEDLNEIEKRIPYPFPESIRNRIIGRYVKGARNYLSFGVEDEEGIIVEAFEEWDY